MMSSYYVLAAACIMANIVLVAIAILIFFSFKQKFCSVLQRLDVLAKETRAVEEKQENNTVCLSDIHGAVFSLYEDRNRIK